MKKAQKALFFIICVTLCVGLLSCATGGGSKGGGEASSVPYTGLMVTYTDENDKGDSTIQMEEIEMEGMPAYRITGGVTTKFIYGFVGWMFIPDEATLENLKNAKAISFKCIGDGKRETVKYRISSVKDHAHFENHFIAETEVVYVEVPIKYFQQPSWGSPVRMNQANVEDIAWQTHESWRVPGTSTPFEITIWDVRIHL